LQITQLEQEILILNNQIGEIEKIRRDVLNNIVFRGFYVTCTKGNRIIGQRRIDGQLHQIAFKNHEMIADIYKKINKYIGEKSKETPKLLDYKGK